MAESSFPVTSTVVAVPVLALTTLIIDMPPLLWHIKNRNLAASSLVAWTLLSNFMNFINPVIWPTDDIMNWWPGYGLCDVEVKLMIAVTFGFVGSLVCIMRNLAKVLDTKKTVLGLSRSQRRRQTIIDCMFCFGGPIYGMAVHYIVQPSRYFVYAISGCEVIYDRSWPRLVLILIWPPIICLVVVYYSVLVIIRMHRYRKDFSVVLNSSNSNMTRSRFLRLFLLSMTLVVVLLPTESYVLYENAIIPMLPYSWDAVHPSGWSSNVVLVPSGGTVIFDRWTQIAVGFALFPFFGLGRDALIMYRKGLLKMGFGRIFPNLHRELRARPQQGSFTGSQASSLGSRARLFLHIKKPKGSLVSSRHNSNPSSIATSSPVEAQRGFGHLAIITESEPKDPSSPSNSANLTPHDPRQSVQTRNRESWLDSFLVNNPISAPRRPWFARPTIPRGTHGLGHFGTNIQTRFRSVNASDLEKN